MIGSDAYNYINILEKAADASWLRNEALNNNIANATTPGYKRQDVQFESYLMTALAGDNSLDDAVQNIDLSEITATVYTEYAGLSYRMDGNNVDASTENAELAKNQIRYNALTDSINEEFNRIRMVLTSK